MLKGKWRLVNELDWQAGGMAWYGEVIVDEDGTKVKRTRLEINRQDKTGRWENALDLTVNGNSAVALMDRLVGYAEGTRFALDGARTDGGSDFA